MLLGVKRSLSKDYELSLSKEEAMKRTTVLGFALAALLAMGFFGIPRSEAIEQDATAAAEAKIPYVANEVLVKFKAGTPASAIVQCIDAVQGTIITHRREIIPAGVWAENKWENRSFSGNPNLLHIKVSPAKGTERVIRELTADPNVEYAEKNYRFRGALSRDDWSTLQWALNNTGTNSGGIADADIDGPDAWNIFTGSSDVVVAVLDGGIEYTHPDLQANMWTNPGEMGDGKDTDLIDNDGNGKVDDAHGWNFAADPENNNTMDDDNESHGTHIAGIIGATGTNGVWGICPYVKLMPVKNFDNSGDTETAWCVSAIDYAVDNGAQILNVSWRAPANSSALGEAIANAQAHGVLVVASAGNWSIFDQYAAPGDGPGGGTRGESSGDYGVNIDQSPRWPASYDLDNIITVLATGNSDHKTWYSHYGFYSVDLGAPGGNDDGGALSDIWSTARNQGYQYLAGTSMAAPFVSGVAALLRGQRPNLDWWQVKTIIMKSVDHKSSLVGYCRTGGRLNAYNALVYPTPVLPAAPTNLVATSYNRGFGFFDIRLTWTDNSNNENGFKIHMKSGNVYEEVGNVGANVTTYWQTDVGQGTYYFYVRASATDGESPKTATVSVYAH